MSELSEAELAPYGRDENGEPIAPYGLKVDGTPARKRGRQAGAAKQPSARRAKRQPKGSYANGIMALLGIPAMVCDMAAKATGNIAFEADKATIVQMAPGFAQGMDEWAQQDPRVAAMLDKVIGVGPAAAVVSSLVFAGVQVAANHKVIPAAPQMGILSAEEKVAAYHAEQAA